MPLDLTDPFVMLSVAFAKDRGQVRYEFRAKTDNRVGFVTFGSGRLALPESHEVAS
jgi:hypothetical protein